MKKYKVKEIFGPTIQGEGSFSGSVVSFLRFSGCNKWSGREADKKDSACPFCDTDFVGGELLSIGEILSMLNQTKTQHVVISGGEPLLQLDGELLNALHENGYFVSVETNGSVALKEELKNIDWIVMSPKQGPEQTKLQRCHDLKLLYPPIQNNITVKDFKSFPKRFTYLQPLMNEKYQENLKMLIAFMYIKKDLKLSLQLHKILGVE